MWRLHGEAVPLDDARVSDFNGLHSRRRDAEVQFYAFHILVSRRRRHSRKTLFVKPERALVTLIQTSALSTVAEQNLVGGVLVVCRDVTAEHKAREALSLINEELKHRVKNTLAVLGAVATQTFRQEASKADLEKYLARLAAALLVVCGGCVGPSYAQAPGSIRVVFVKAGLVAGAVAGGVTGCGVVAAPGVTILTMFSSR